MVFLLEMLATAALHEISGAALFRLHKLSENRFAQLRMKLEYGRNAPSISVSSVKRKSVLMFPFRISDRGIYPRTDGFVFMATPGQISTGHQGF